MIVLNLYNIEVKYIEIVADDTRRSAATATYRNNKIWLE